MNTNPRRADLRVGKNAKEEQAVLLRGIGRLDGCSDASELEVALDVVTGALQGLFRVPKDVDNNNLEELLAWLSSRHWVDKSATEALEEVLQIEDWDKYDEAVIQKEQVDMLADTLRELHRRIKAHARS